LINSWITIWQSLIINLLLHTVQLHCAAHLQKANSHRAPLERIYGSVHFIQCATVLSLWEHFILLVWSASYILLTFEPAHCLLESRTAESVQLLTALLLLLHSHSC